MPNDSKDDTASSGSPDELAVVDDPVVATTIINQLDEEHDVELKLGRATGPLGTWIDVYVGEKRVASMDYFSGADTDNEGVIWYVLPELIERDDNR
jgi:hypothetical protein